MFNTNSIKTSNFFKTALNELELTAMRKTLLTSIATFIADELKEKRTVNLNFICTHNSRRSQLSQVWAQYAIEYYKLSNIHSFSGGTEETAFFSNTVKTLQEVGFEFHIQKFSHQNPVYEIHADLFKAPLIGFSKVYDHTINQKPFIAITTCNNADENCPFIPDTVKRFHLPFVDPKASDNEPNTMEVYKNISKTIAGELSFVFKTVKTLVG